MESVVLVIHLFLAIGIIGLVLLQRSEGGGLGIGGSGGGLGNVASAKSMNNVLTKATTFCAIAFFATSLTLGVMARSDSAEKHSITESLEDAVAIEAVVDDVDTPIEIPAAPVSE